MRRALLASAVAALCISAQPAPQQQLQYIAVLSGWGGSYALSGGKAAAMSGNLRNVSRLLVFKLGGTGALPALEPRAIVINPPPEPADAASIARGERLFDQYCSACHGEHAIGGGVEHALFASLAVRLQGDYQHTTFGDSAGAIQGQNDLRLTTSMVYRFGHRE